MARHQLIQGDVLAPRQRNLGVVRGGPRGPTATAEMFAHVCEEAWAQRQLQVTVGADLYRWGRNASAHRLSRSNQRRGGQRDKTYGGPGHPRCCSQCSRALACPCLSSPRCRMLALGGTRPPFREVFSAGGLPASARHAQALPHTVMCTCRFPRLPHRQQLPSRKRRQPRGRRGRVGACNCPSLEADHRRRYLPSHKPSHR